MAGRAYAYGSARRAARVFRVRSRFARGSRAHTQLLGCASVAELGRSYLNVPRDWLKRVQANEPRDANVTSRHSSCATRSESPQPQQAITGNESAIQLTPIGIVSVPR
jgi:hypothetical protein